MKRLENIVITAVDDIYMIPSLKGRYLEMKDRVDYGLSFCKSGRITYTQNGKVTISDRWHAVFLPQGGSYTLYGDESGVFPLINFRTLSPFTDEFISIELQNPEIYIKELEQMQSYFAAGNKTRVFKVMYGLLDRLCGELGESNILEPAIKYMEKHFRDERLNNSLLARQLNISEVYFRRLFKEKYNTTPHRYLLNLRLEKAKQLLSDRSLTVTLIAEECGFSGVYHFCKAFKENVGQTPTGYRKSLERLEL